MRTYWKLRLNHNRFYDWIYLWTDKSLPPEEIPQEALNQRMLINIFLENIDQVRKITKEEYSMHMWE